VTLRRVPRRPGLYEVRPGTYKLVRYAGKNGDRSKQRSRTFHAASDRAAIKAANGIADELDREIVEATARAGTVNGLCDKWERDRAGGHSPSTIRGGAARLNRIRRDLGHIRLDDLNAGTVDGWMTDLRNEGLSPTTVANHYSALRALVRQGEKWDMIPSTKAVDKATPPSRQSYRKGQPPTAQAVGVLWKTATPDLKVAVALAAWAGLRRGEVMGLRWSDIDAIRCVIHVRRARALDRHGVEHDKLPKSGKARDVKVDAWLINLLAEHREALEARAEALTGDYDPFFLADAPVLPDLTGHTLHPTAPRFKGKPFGTVPRKLDWLTLAWRRHAAKQGAPSVRYHDLRHHFATEMIEAGIPMTAVQGQLGHLQLATTMGVYSHVVDDTRRRAAGVVAARRRIPGAPTPELSATTPPDEFRRERNSEL
jgi:integrase